MEIEYEAQKDMMREVIPLASNNIVLCKWSMAILLTLSDKPRHFSELAKQLTISNKVLSEKLQLLISNSMVERISNEGNGVVYTLTDYGREVVEFFQPLFMSGLSPLDANEIIKCKWSMEILKNLWRGTMFSGELLRNIEGITWKVLSEKLKKLEQIGLVRREVIPSYPIRVRYSLTRKGRLITSWLINNTCK